MNEVHCKTYMIAFTSVHDGRYVNVSNRTALSSKVIDNNVDALPFYACEVLSEMLLLLLPLLSHCLLNR